MMAMAPFDHIARTYDDLWSGTAAGRAQRAIVWSAIDPLFQPGDTILDVGCGTGEDAVHLSRRGVRVSAIDASAAMVQIASSRGVDAMQVAIEELGRVPAAYDGVLSNFGAINCTADLAAVAASLARLVRPRGYIAVCLLNRVSAWEMTFFGSRFQWRKAFRRLRPGGVMSSLGVRVHYPPARDVRKAFAPTFDWVQSVGVGVFVPPSYGKLPEWAVRIAAGVESWTCKFPLVRAIGDHRLYVFRRRALC
jgi:ubiquinone/menaquinone biosynthesis C-methylase UbiE